MQAGAVGLAGFIAVGMGAAAGAWLRWGLSIWFNQQHSHFPFGTFAANALGGLLVGLAVGYFGKHPDMSPMWRLLVITGFLGGLTTFSTYSAEVIGLITRGELVWALVVGGAHLIVSLILTALGVWLTSTFWSVG